MARKYSSEYKNLQPYVVEDIRKVVNAAGASGGGSVTQGVTDHGALTGLGDDDHPQYLTPVRGDARYIPATRQVIAGSGITGGGALSADVTLALTTPGTLTVSSTNTATGSHTHAITASADVGTSPAAALLKSTAGGALTLASLAVKGTVDITNNGDLTVAGSGSYAGNTVLFADSSGGNVGIMMTPDPQFALDVNGPARATYFVGPHAIQLKNVMLLSHYDGRAPFPTNWYGEPNGHMGQIATVAGSVVYAAGKFGKALQTGPTTLNRCTNPSFETGTTGWAYSDSNSSGSMVRTSYNSYSGSYSLQLFNATAGQDDCAYFQVAGLSANTAYTVSAYAYVTDEFGGGALNNRGLYALDTNSAGTAQTTTITGSTGGLWVRHTVTVTMSNSPGNLQIRLYNPKGRTYWDAVQVELGGGATGYADGDMPGHTWTGTAHASTSNRTTTAYLTYPTAGNVNALRGTIMAWVYPYSAFGAGTIWRITGAVAGYIILRTNGYNLETYWGTTQLTGTGALTPNAWMHVAITYDSTTLRLYVNGAEVANAASSGFDTLPANMFIGSADGTNSPMAALLDDFCTLDRTAPAAEIKSVYESNAPVFAESSTFSFRPTPKGLIWADDEGLWMRATDGDTVLGVYGNDAQTKSWGGQTMSAGDLLIGNATNYVFWDDSAALLSISGSLVVGTTNKIWLNESNDGVLAIGGSTKASAPFRVTAAGDLTATSATITGAITASSGSLTGFLTLGASGGIYQGTGTSGSPTTGLKIWNDGGVGRIGAYNAGDLQWFNSTTGYLYAGRNATASTTQGADRWGVRLARDGVRLLAEATTSFNQSTSASSIRWIFNSSDDIDATLSTATSYVSLYAYNNTSVNVVYSGMTTFVGSGVYTTKDATVYLSAQHYTGSVYHGVDFTLTCVKSTGVTYAYCNADEFQIPKVLKMDEMTAPAAPAANGVVIFAQDNGSGKTQLCARFSSGAIQQLAIQP